jgi:hypothetical protein
MEVTLLWYGECPALEEYRLVLKGNRVESKDAE